MGRLIAGGLMAAALCAGAGVARADVIDFEDLALGAYTDPIAVSGPRLFAIGSPTIVDTGAGNQALQISGNQVPSLTFGGVQRISADLQNVYDLDSVDVFVTQPTPYSATGDMLGFIPANTWFTWTFPGEVQLNRGGATKLQFGWSQLPTTVLVDNITYHLVGQAAVPEPATWAMLIVGFGLLGLQLRRRRLAGAPA